MSQFLFTNNRKGLTDDEMLRILESDDPEFDSVINEETSSDLEDEDIVTEVEEENDVIVVDQSIEKTNPEEPTVSNSQGIPVYKSKDGTEWSKIPGNTKVRRSKANIRRHALGLTNYSSDISSIKDAFLLFLSPDILNIIVTETNRKAQTYYDKWNIENPNKIKVFVPVDSTEIEAYIGLLLILGALHGSKEAIDMLWCQDISYCRPIIPAAMSRDRFKQITSFLRFDNFQTRQERKLVDKLAPIRDIFDIFTSNCKKSLNPGDHLCVDEQLVPFRGKAPFRVYMKSKPDKYGIKIWALVDCTTSYIANMQVYLGKLFEKQYRQTLYSYVSINF